MGRGNRKWRRNCRRAGTTRLSPKDFDDAVGINEHCFLLAEINDEMIVPGCPDISGFLERILRAVVEANAKGAKRLAFHHALDVFDFHEVKIASGAGAARLDLRDELENRGVVGLSLAPGFSRVNRNRLQPLTALAVSRMRKTAEAVELPPSLQHPAQAGC